MENKIVNVRIVAEVARALKELKEKVVFVGGAVISLYTDDPAADEVRPSDDIDLTIQLSGYAEWVKIQHRLAELRFSPNPQGHAICSYLYNKIMVDIMPAEDGPIGRSNPWYKPGFEYLQEIAAEGETIRILSASYFLATKFQAFLSRGSDFRTSHDFEDVIYIVDNRTTIVNDVRMADEKVKTFLKNEFNKVLENPNFEENIIAQIHPLMVEYRYPLVLEKIKAIIS